MLYFAANQGLYSIYAMIHSLFLVCMAYWDFQMIYSKMAAYADQRGGWAKITAVDGFRCLLIGVMHGASGYFSGNAMSASADTILKMVGLNGSDAAGANKDYDTLYTLTTEQTVLIYL